MRLMQMLNASLESLDEMPGAYQHAHSGGDREAATGLPMAVVPIRRLERIKQLYMVGGDIRRIAREEIKNQAHVRRIVQTYAIPQYIEEARKELLCLSEHALAAIRHALEIKKDDELAYRLLIGCSVITK